MPECGDAEDERAALQTVFPTIFEDQLNGDDVADATVVWNICQLV